MRFENAFCTNSICTPSRATIMTGQYSQTNGVLTLDEIAAVSMYERVAFGGAALEDAAVSCGIVAADEGGEETSEEPAEEAAGS